MDHDTNAAAATTILTTLDHFTRPHSAHQTASPSEESQPGPSHNLSKLPEERQFKSQSTTLLPLYVFDEREIELSGLPNYRRKGPEARTKEYKFWKTGAFRAR